MGFARRSRRAFFLPMKILIIYILAVLISWHAGAFWLGFSAWTPDVWGTLWFLVGFWLRGALETPGSPAKEDFQTLISWLYQATYRRDVRDGERWRTGLEALEEGAQIDAPAPPEPETMKSKIVGTATGWQAKTAGDLGQGWQVETDTKGKKTDRSDAAMRRRAKNIGLSKF